MQNFEFFRPKNCQSGNTAKFLRDRKKNGCRIRNQRPEINKVLLVSDKVHFLVLASVITFVHEFPCSVASNLPEDILRVKSMIENIEHRESKSYQ